jgi:DNA-binding MarR family transcriptional regulator
MEPVVGDELPSALFERFAAVYRMLHREAAELGMSRSAISLLAQLRDGGPQRVSDLAALEAVAQPSMTALVARLERQGLVRRTADPRDGRAVVVRLSPSGRRRLQSVARSSVRRLDQRVGQLDPEHRAALRAALPALDELTRAVVQESERSSTGGIR